MKIAQNFGNIFTYGIQKISSTHMCDVCVWVYGAYEQHPWLVWKRNEVAVGVCGSANLALLKLTVILLNLQFITARTICIISKNPSSLWTFSARNGMSVIRILLLFEQYNCQLLERCFNNSLSFRSLRCCRVGLCSYYSLQSVIYASALTMFTGHFSVIFCWPFQRYPFNRIEMQNRYNLLFNRILHIIRHRAPSRSWGSAHANMAKWNFQQCAI